MSKTLPDILAPALRQYRHNDDNSPSLFFPEQGFAAAFEYDKTLEIVSALQEREAQQQQEIEALKRSTQVFRELVEDALEDETEFDTEWDKTARKALQENPTAEESSNEAQ